MGILDELSSSTGDENSNHEMVKQCMATPGRLHTIAEGLRTGSPPAQLDCAQILVQVAQDRPDLLADFVTDFLDASRSKNKSIAKLGFAGLTQVVNSRPQEVYAEREYLFNVAHGGGAIGLAAAEVLAALCNQNPNYRGKLLSQIIRLLQSIAPKDQPKWFGVLGAGFSGSSDSIKRFREMIEHQRSVWPDPIAKKMDRLLLKLERTLK